MEPIEEFRRRNEQFIREGAADGELRSLTRGWFALANRYEYSYHFSWLGRPVIQYPQDIVAFQELVWQCRPDLIIETGIAHGGSLVLSASLLALLDLCDAAEAGVAVDPRNPKRRVVGVDIDIRRHNRAAMDAHPLRHRIEMIEGSSIDPGVVARVRAVAAGFERVMICLDSNHTHEHVLAELEAYADLTSQGCYCCVFDTVVEDLPPEATANRPWGPGDSPKTAVREFLRRLGTQPRLGSDGHPLHLESDRLIDDKLLISVAPEGYLRRLPV